MLRDANTSLHKMPSYTLHRAFCPAVSTLHSARHIVRRASEPGSEGPPIINEDVLVKLRKFEEENARLRAQLQSQDAQAVVDNVDGAKKGTRIDGTGMKRETMFTDTDKTGGWLSEADVDFFTGGGAFEKPGQMTDDEQATITKRVLIGAGLSVVALVFALIPTESLDGQSNKPLSFYLVPVIRSINLLEDLATEISEDRYDSIPLVIARILDKPNEARKNMYAAIEFIKSSSQAKQSARETVGNFLDYVQQVDYNTYYDTVKKQPADGKQNAQMVDFSLQSVRAAVRSGREFLSYFPSAEVRAAKELVETPGSA